MGLPLVCGLGVSLFRCSGNKHSPTGIPGLRNHPFVAIWDSFVVRMLLLNKRVGVVEESGGNVGNFVGSKCVQLVCIVDTCIGEVAHVNHFLLHRASMLRPSDSISGRRPLERRCWGLSIPKWLICSTSGRGCWNARYTFSGKFRGDELCHQPCFVEKC